MSVRGKKTEGEREEGEEADGEQRDPFSLVVLN